MKSSVAISLAFVVLSPLACLAAENWAEKVFPNPADCTFADGNSISYDADEKRIIVRGRFSRDIKDELESIENNTSGSCKPNDSSGLSIRSAGQFFGSDYSSFTIPIYGSGDGGCMSDFYYSFTFMDKADVLHDNILRRTGKNLTIVTGSGGPSRSADEAGWITDYGNYTVYTCSMIGY
ncbi:hypothetical protein [Rhizobium leguminosarum]|uniref:Uncharacterized protein n=1 Tax=Rhizobium leguminosarum TaxID=384 RepID=A0A2Z4YW14_RHILE|nr:hypothetical protein [Rhizobium leguminosarum]AXA44652.1 hypothetical protein DLJ82_6682 [Rhizobium leguminosarum]